MPPPPPLSAEGNWSEFHEAELILRCVVGWRWKARIVNVLGGKVAKKKKSDKITRKV